MQLGVLAQSGKQVIAMSGIQGSNPTLAFFEHAHFRNYFIIEYEQYVMF